MPAVSRVRAAGTAPTAACPPPCIAPRHLTPTPYSQGYAFVEFTTVEDAEYAAKVMNMVKLWGKAIRVTKSESNKHRTEIGANLFIGNLAPEVDEQAMHATFAAFGNLIDAPMVSRDPDTGMSRGFGFVKYDSFEAADLAIASMNTKFFGGRPIVVQYSFKKDKPGERHGTPAERHLAAQAKANMSTGELQPHKYFASAPGEVNSIIPEQRPGPSMGGMQPPPYGAPPMMPPPPPLQGYGAPVHFSMPMPPPPPTAVPPAPGMAMPPPPPPGAVQRGHAPMPHWMSTQ